ncbi:MAG TPA: VCBS repeat-containing protein, partial [Gemmataceae bacterium]|nr:VCBS repeat-containing protein [Gemmataceae bacterium]
RKKALAIGTISCRFASADGTATILFGNGDGSFQLGQTYVAGGSPIVVADVNGDGIPDLVVLAGVLLGNGNGTFQPLLAFSAGEGPNSLAVADFNGDGVLDIVTTNFGVGGDPRNPVVTENGVRILLGNGDGTFQAAQPIAIQPSDSRPAFVVVGDWNHDGNVDLAVASAESGTLTILLGKGDGTFQVGRTYMVGAGLTALAVADLNGDGQLDVVAANTGTFLVSGKLTVFLGKGDGTFQPGHTYPIAPRPYTLSVAIGDFNHDGIADVVLADGSGARIFLGNGDGTLQAAQVYAAGSGGDLVVADWNGDGLPDLALSNSATILLNQP